MWLQLLFFFCAGVVLLGLGANWLVQGASLIARILRIPKAVVGLTLVALGTSAPELFVNLLAGWHGDTGLALSNVSGSNLANVCVGFGLCAFIDRLAIRRADFGSDVILLVVAPSIVFLLFYTNPARVLPFWTTLPLTLVLAYYLISLRGREPDEEDLESQSKGGILSGTSWFALGVVCLYGGGEMVLHSATRAATSLNVSQSILGLTVVAFGTSVPDITASVVAAKRKEFGIAIGNILGSNISNVALVLNGTILISGHGLTTDLPIRLDYAAVLVTSGLVCFAAWSWQRVSRPTGALLLAMYLAYLTFRIVTVAL